MPTDPKVSHFGEQAAFQIYASRQDISDLPWNILRKYGSLMEVSLSKNGIKRQVMQLLAQNRSLKLTLFPKEPWLNKQSW